MITIIKFLYLQKHHGTQLFWMKFPHFQNINHEQVLKNESCLGDCQNVTLHWLTFISSIYYIFSLLIKSCWLVNHTINCTSYHFYQDLRYKTQTFSVLEIFFHCVGIISIYQMKYCKENDVWWFECLSLGKNLINHGIAEKWNLRNYNLSSDKWTANKKDKWKDDII